MMSFEAFKEKVRQGERSGEIVTDFERPFTDFELAVQWAIGGLRDKGVKRYTTEMVYDELPNEFKWREQSVKRSWERAFQKWSDEHGIEATEHIESYGCCGYGSMCDWCKDNSYGRPCVRALNAMCREKGIRIDYSDRDFEKVWNGQINKRRNEHA